MVMPTSIVRYKNMLRDIVELVCGDVHDDSAVLHPCVTLEGWLSRCGPPSIRHQLERLYVEAV